MCYPGMRCIFPPNMKWTRYKELAVESQPSLKMMDSIFKIKIKNKKTRAVGDQNSSAEDMWWVNSHAILNIAMQLEYNWQSVLQQQVGCK